MPADFDATRRLMSTAQAEWDDRMGRRKPPCPECERLKTGWESVARREEEQNAEIERLRTALSDLSVSMLALLERVEVAMSAAEWANIPGRWQEVLTDVRVAIDAAKARDRD